MTVTPSNEGYYHAAYIAAVVIYGAYALSLWWRTRQVRGGMDGR